MNDGELFYGLSFARRARFYTSIYDDMAYDDFAVKVVNNEGTTIRYVPRELSEELSGYFNGGGRILVKVVGKRENRPRRGLEVPAVYRVF